MGMTLATSWLRQWVTFDDANQVADMLTSLGLEVESLTSWVNQPVHDLVVVAQIESVAKHPDADRLHVCQITKGDGDSLTVVCGCPSVRPGLKVALAQVGTILPNGMIIKAAKLRGQPSHGMLCSAQELGIPGNDGIMHLDKDAPLGVCIHQYLALDDQVLDIAITPNRGDCFSAFGLARDVAAKTQKPIALTSSFHPLNVSSSDIDHKQTAQIESADCSVLVTAHIDGIDTSISSPWVIQKRLLQAGIQPINAVVDVTQYVMLEMGQPMHAYDAAQIQGHLRVKRIEENTSVLMLDKREINFKSQALVVADDHKIVSLAGIMGAQSSAINTQTSQIIFESAHFQPKAIRKLASQYQIQTASSMRFERGVDTQLPTFAMQRAIELIMDIMPNAKLSYVNHQSNRLTQPVVELTYARILDLLGLELPKQWICQMLDHLGCRVLSSSDQGIRVEVPSHRFDLCLDVDLIEELARLKGYDQLQGAHRIHRVEQHMTDLHAFNDRTHRQHLVSRGYHEVVTYGFISAQEHAWFDSQAPIELINPLSQSLAVMRRHPLPGLLKTAMYNINRQEKGFKIFEIARGFLGLEQGQQPMMIAGLLCGNAHQESWSCPNRPIDFYDAKGDVQLLLQTYGIEAVFERGNYQGLHPGQTADIFYKNKKIGYIGALCPVLKKKLDINLPIMMFLIEEISSLSSDLVPISMPPRYPSIRRDISLIVENNMTCQAIIDLIYESGIAILTKVQLFDVYKTQDRSMLCMSFALCFRDADATLSDQDVNACMQSIGRCLAKHESLTVRD